MIEADRCGETIAMIIEIVLSLHDHDIPAFWSAQAQQDGILVAQRQSDFRAAFFISLGVQLADDLVF